MLKFKSTIRHFRVTSVPEFSAWNLLKRLQYVIEPANAEYLAEKTLSQSGNVIPFGKNKPNMLPRDWTEFDTFHVVGPIHHTVALADYALVEIRDPTNTHEELSVAGNLLFESEYYPVEAGEFLQLVWLMCRQQSQHRGIFLCAKGRKPGYAISAQYTGTDTARSFSLVFDRYVGDTYEKLNVPAGLSVFFFYARRFHGFAEKSLHQGQR